MAKMLENDTRTEAWAEIWREIDSMPEGQKLTPKQLVALLRRLPPPPPGFTSSAEIIRELRGPLPEDDPEFQQYMNGRR